MTLNDTTIISDFESKLHQLIHEYKQKVEQNNELARKIEEKENILIELQKHCAALENNYNNLKQAKIISLNQDGIEVAKEKISRLVREIDRCIESLKKQPE